jgi:hypothetical protein
VQHVARARVGGPVDKCTPDSLRGVRAVPLLASSQPAARSTKADRAWSVLRASSSRPSSSVSAALCAGAKKSVGSGPGSGPPPAVAVSSQ